MDVDDDAVTVRARGAPLEDVIEEIAQQGRLRLVTYDRLEEPITVELRSSTLSAALRELLPGRSFILAGAPETTGGTSAGGTVLWILSKESNGHVDSARLFNGTDGSHDSDADLQSPEELRAAIADDDSNVRLDTVSELSHRDNVEAASILASAASRDARPSVRAEALYALGVRRADARNPAFARALADADPGVRKAAIGALETVGTESSLPVLTVALSDRDASVRATAVDAIGEIGGDAARRLLESALDDESAVVRDAAASQLGE